MSIKKTDQFIFWVILFLTITCNAIGQTISSSIPSKVDINGNYLFYLHAGVVTELGNNAINQSVPEWVPYEYFNILDSLRKHGFNVISEIREKGIDDSVYVNKISNQVDSLMKTGVRANKIVVVGASSGWGITLGVSSKLKNEKMKYVIMGGCRSETYKDYLNTELYGQFLSITEATDPHGTCYMIFDKRNHVKSYQEITLHTGLSHGFIYKGHKEWIEPIVNWFEKK
ncbi:MAG TPA: hypothetical protein VII44_10735 [Puia sp.]